MKYRHFSMRPGFSIALGLAIVVGAAVVAAKQNVAEDGAYRQVERFTRAMEQVRARYVDPSKVGYEQLIDGAISGMLRSLDPFSEYLSPENFAQLEEDTEGRFGGVGIVVNSATGCLEVVETIPEAPADKSGIQPGDRITGIDGQPTDGMTMDDAVSRMRGKPGTSVAIEVAARNHHAERNLKLKREVIKIPAVMDACIVREGVGYLRLAQFNEPAIGELKQGIDRLIEQGMRYFVLDLRNNPGGLLESAIAVGQLFVESGAEIVSTLGRTPDAEEIFKAKGREHYALPMCVLVNGESASAAEIVAGALQDHKRAVLVGERTFGKASVQSILPFEDGSALRITTAHYYTPAHRLIHEKGIEPDIVVAMDPSTLFRLPKEPDRFEKDVQLQRAIAELTRPKDAAATAKAK